MAYALGGPQGYRYGRDPWGAIGLDLDLMAGPDVLLPLLHRLGAAPGPDGWYPDDEAHGGAVVDPDRKVLLFFAWDAPSASAPTRAAALALLRGAWPGWDVRWSYAGQTGLRGYLGLDPEQDLSGPIGSFVCPAPGLAGAPAAVATVGPDRCHVLDGVNEHPVTEGPALLERLRSVPRHLTYGGHADAGIHVDPQRRRVGWWLTGAQEHAERVPARWPGWTVEFWEDRWSEHARAAPGRFLAPAPDPAAALAGVRDWALDRYAPPAAGERAAPCALVGLGHPPPVTAGLAAAARETIGAAYRAAGGC
ncbi:hypothetical protein [Streptomyces sp. cmx-4-9]|uniref:hypothetical protein n=1 Tax=Streptomyces sp. cmx-4-9 TaxID=2790941 RepID=UPI00397FAA19